MTPADQDRPARLLAAAFRVLPAERRDWGRGMQAELTAVAEPSDRWAFAWGCLRAAAAEFRLLRGGLHLLVALGALGALLAWVATVDFPPLTWILAVVVSVLTAVCWAARRSTMLGPTGDGVFAWVLRSCGYLIAVAIVAVAVTHSHPATLEAADAGVGLLVWSTIAASLLLGSAAVGAKRSAATARVLLTGAGSGLAATLIWLVVVLVAPPIPTSVGGALALTGVAAAGAVLANAGGSVSTAGRLLAGLLATATTLVLIFAGVVLLARWGPDSVIPAIVPHALPAHRVDASRTEIVDPYVLVLILGAVAATALGAAAVVTRRPRPARRPATTVESHLGAGPGRSGRSFPR
jgi:hypothetical protein